MLSIEEIYIIKSSGSSGEASVKIVDSEDDSFGDLNIKKIQIDILNSISPISILKSGGTPIVSGAMFDTICNEILTAWNSIEDEIEGLYRITHEKIAREG